MIFSQCFSTLITCLRPILCFAMHPAAIAKGAMVNATSVAHCYDRSKLVLTVTTFVSLNVREFPRRIRTTLFYTDLLYSFVKRVQ